MGRSYCVGMDGVKIFKEYRRSMPAKKPSQPAAKANGNSAGQQTEKKKLPYATRYVAVESHLTERNGSTEFVFGLASERPAGRKLAQDIDSVCNQLAAEGYDVISIMPVTGGRAVEATVEAAESVHGRTYNRWVKTQESRPQDGFSMWAGHQRQEQKHYIDTGVGYSVTEGAVITAKLRC